jgi:hypothetical protein
MLNELIKKYPKTMFLVFNKLFWCTSFFYTIYIIQNQIPNLKQWALGSIYVLITMPINYWLTYGFTETKENE